jgi:NEDD4-binding protein 2
MKELVLVRGVSGSGKSTLVDALWDVSTIIRYSTDDFFMVDGEYKFDPALLGENHLKCQHAVERSMMLKLDDPYSCVIMVANTFTELWEMDPYIALAKKYGFRVHTIVVENRHRSTSIHDVPPAVLKAQEDRFEVVL